MSSSLAGVLAMIGVGRINHAYALWLYAESECTEKLNRWQHGDRVDGEAAYVAYRAALEREEAAAHELKQLWERVAPYGERVLDGRHAARRRLN